MIFDASILFAGFAFGFFIGTLLALINLIKAWFVKTAAR